MHVLLVSPSFPAQTSAGRLILFRHFSRCLELVVGAIASEKNGNGDLRASVYPHRLLERISRTRFHRYANDVMHCVGPFCDRRDTNRLVARHPWDVVLTVAEGWQWQVAVDIAAMVPAPLVTIFHDWWPEVAELHPAARQLFTRRLIRLGDRSALIFCVSEGMKTKLGRPEKSVVLYPLPHDQFFPVGQTSREPGPACLVYAGALNGIFAPPLRSLSASLAVQDRIAGQFFGAPPEWETPFYQGFVPRSYLETALAQADVLLVVVPFDPKRRVWAETSFSSKLVEYCRFGRPILLWSPSYSAAAVWAVEHGAAALVTQPEPGAVLEEVARLMGDESRRRSLGERARHMAETMFDPEHIHGQFVQGLERVVREWRKHHG
jgi:glycosyltransferase involved in cell wall biosynthesis